NQQYLSISRESEGVRDFGICARLTCCSYERVCLAANGGNKKRKGLERSIYPTLQTLQVATTLE
ncbi:MAG: hypothetical protein WC389_21160, partial [Lutibacter sp.]